MYQLLTLIPIFSFIFVFLFVKIKSQMGIQSFPFGSLLAEIKAENPFRFSAFGI